MKKKGFTLVELLAVIAILAILVILALPNVLGMFNDAKKSTFITEAQTIYKQAETDFIADSFEKGAGARWYCSDGAADADGKSRNNCKKLNMTTNKEYAVATFNDGSIEYIAVTDASYVFGLRADEGTRLTVTDITGSLVVDRSTVDPDEVQMWYFRTAHKVQPTNNNGGGAPIATPSGGPKGSIIYGFESTEEDGKVTE